MSITVHSFFNIRHPRSPPSIFHHFLTEIFHFRTGVQARVRAEGARSRQDLAPRHFRGHAIHFCISQPSLRVQVRLALIKGPPSANLPGTILSPPPCPHFSTLPLFAFVYHLHKSHTRPHMGNTVYLSYMCT